ncbi:unnamed protein product [Lampetra fluviatilis]
MGPLHTGATSCLPVSPSGGKRDPGVPQDGLCNRAREAEMGATAKGRPCVPAARPWRGEHLALQQRQRRRQQQQQRQQRQQQQRQQQQQQQRRRRQQQQRQQRQQQQRQQQQQQQRRRQQQQQQRQHSGGGFCRSVLPGVRSEEGRGPEFTLRRF